MNKIIMIAALSAVCVFTGCKNASKQRAGNISSETNLPSRQKTSQDKPNVNNDITLLLTRQLNAGHYASGAGDMMLYDINLSDFQITEELILDSLEKRGFVIPSDSSFLKRIKTIFGFDMQIGGLIHLRTKGDDENIIIKKENPFAVGDGNIGVIHIDGDKRIISKTWYLPDIIDYKNIFPNLAELEKEIDTQQILKNKFYGEEEDWEIHLWNEGQYSDFNMEWLLHLNQYILYDNQASFIWLSINAPDFLKDLLLTFGYDKEERINKLVLDDDNISLMNKFFSRDTYGKVKIHEGVLRTIGQFSLEDCSKYFEAASSFVDLIGYHPRRENDNRNAYPALEGLTLKERHQIIAYVINTLQPLYEKYNGEEGYGNLDQFDIGIVDCFWNAFFDDHELLQDIEANNCYNLPNLTKLLQKIRQDERLINEQTGTLEPWKWSPKKYLDD